MKFVPVLEIVQAHRIFWNGSVIGNAARAQNTAARLIIVIISAYRRVVLLDRIQGKRPGVFLYPRFEFGIRRLVLLDVISYCLLFESECGKSHRIEAFADGRITGSKFTRRFKGDFLPETREMDNAKWTGNARADQWNVCVTHNDVFAVLMFRFTRVGLVEGYEFRQYESR